MARYPFYAEALDAVIDRAGVLPGLAFVPLRPRDVAGHAGRGLGVEPGDGTQPPERSTRETATLDALNRALGELRQVARVPDARAWERREAIAAMAKYLLRYGVDSPEWAEGMQVARSVLEAVRRREDDDSYTYDAVVLDAPPTGRITRFLNVNEEVAGLAKAGPVRRQADSIMTMMRSRRTAVHLVTLLEEMPVQETMDAVNELTDAGLGVGHVVVNQVLPSPLSDAAAERIASGALTSTAVAKSLARVDVQVEPQAAEALLSEGREHVARQRLQTHQRGVLLEAGSPVLDVHYVLEGLPPDVPLDDARALVGLDDGVLVHVVAVQRVGPGADHRANLLGRYLMTK